MMISTSYEVGNLILIKGSKEHWKIIAIHVSLYDISYSVYYDVQKKDNCRRLVKEHIIIGLVS
jgi:hypothetical protein